MSCAMPARSDRQLRVASDYSAPTVAAMHEVGGAVERHVMRIAVDEALNH